MRAIHLIVLVSLFFVAIFAPETHAESVSGSESGADFHLKGVLISRSGSSALVNDTVLREGEQVEGIRILEIREGEVRIRRGSQQLSVRVGTRAHWDLATPYSPPAEPILAQQPQSAASYGPVQRGETLSEIAESQLVGDLTINQMMVALYDTNPDAFDGNINLLREGAVLHIPNPDVLQRQSVATATAEVLRQTAAWRDGFEQWLQPAVVATLDVYGPVTRGQTLSGIAASLARGGTTMNQMMIALFETNPQAFDGNINLLQEGAVLEVPDDADLLRYSHASATATVMQHAEAWRHGDVQPLQSSTAPDDEPTLPDDFIQADDAVLLSMQGSR